jgi:hypothetical protein
MDAMIRTNLFLGKDQRQALIAEAAKQHISLASLVRRYIDAGLPQFRISQTAGFRSVPLYTCKKSAK